MSLSGTERWVGQGCTSAWQSALSQNRLNFTPQQR